MPYKKPLREKGIREPPYWHFIKLCWFMVHFEDIFDKISIRKFCIDFIELVISKGIIEKIELEYGLTWEWNNEDGTPIIPDYDKLMNPNSKPKKYKWYAHYPIFKTDRLQLIENSEREKFIRNIPNLTKSCYDTINHCAKREKQFDQIETETGGGMDYPRNKNTDTKKNEVEMLMNIIGLDKSDDIPDNNMPELTPIIENPSWLNKDELKARNDYVWDNLPKRDGG